MQLVEIDADGAGQRVDNFLLRVLKGVPRSRIYRLLRKGEVRVNGGRVGPDRKLTAGDKVRIPPVRTGTVSPTAPSAGLLQTLRDAITFEDERILVVNKPAGLAVHGGSGISAGLIETLRQLLPEERSLELIHRLDRDTSGCVMVAKRRSALRLLQAQLREKTGLAKFYLVVVHGRWVDGARSRIDLPLTRNLLRSGERISRVAVDGKPSTTLIRVLATSDSLSLLEAQPITGRTHQIRVHCAASGFPVVGDQKYGVPDRDRVLPGGVPRMMLHARRLVIPSWEEGGPAIEIEAGLDAAYVGFLSKNGLDRKL